MCPSTSRSSVCPSLLTPANSRASVERARERSRTVGAGSSSGVGAPTTSPTAVSSVRTERLPLALSATGSAATDTLVA